MGYFNFYILREFYKRNKKLVHKILFFIAIFFIVSILRSNCFAFDYNSDYYVQWYDNVKSKTYRVCSDKPIILIPKQSNRTALNANDMYTGNVLPISLYVDSVFQYDSTGSWFATNTAFYGGSPNINAYKGSYIAFKYDTSLQSLYEFSSNCPPFIYNKTDISNWDFTDLQIVLGNTIQPFPHNDRWTFILTVQHNGVNYTYDVTNNLQQIVFEGNSNLTTYGRLSIPRYNILNDAVVKKNDIVRIYLQTKYTTNNIDYIIDNYNLGSYTIGADLSTSESLSAINDNISNVNNSVQQTTDAVESLEQTITDPSVSDDSISLPTISVNDPTQAGIDQVFTQFYNAFCTGSSSSIVFPIPNTNKNITLPGNFVYDMLHNNGGDFIITFVTAFWWYTIGSWVVRDIWDKIFKIQEGEVENMQTTNIKADML